MRKIVLLAIVCAGIVLVQGCSAYWYQQDTTFEQYLQDSKDCESSDNYRGCMFSKGYHVAITPEFFRGRQVFVGDKTEY